MRDSKKSVKFMQVLDRGIFLKLKELAKARGVTVQELLRVLVIPDWMRRSEEYSKLTNSRRIHRRMKTVSRPSPIIARVQSDRRNE